MFPQYIRGARHLALGALALCVSVAPLSAQGNLTERFSDDRGFYLAYNVLAGGMSAMLRSFFTDAKPIPAFAKGAIGGSLTYGGMRMIGTKDPALRFAGIQTVALGANVARNAGAGEGALSDLTMPLFPLYLRMRWEDSRPHISVRLSGMSAASLVYFAAGGRGEVDFDWKESLISGSPVFHTDREELICWTRSERTGNCLQSQDGVAAFGVVAYSEAGKDTAGYHLLTHEIGHVAQFVRDGIMHAVPASDWIVPKIDDIIRFQGATKWGTPFGTLSKYIVLDIVLPIRAISAQTSRTDWPYGATLHEREVDVMMGVDYCTRHQINCSW